MTLFKRLHPLLSATLVTLLLAITNPAKAASILIDADNINSLVTFTFGQFEGGFSINGSTPTTGGSFAFGDDTQLNFTGQWIDLGSVLSFSRTVYWENPGAPNVIEQILNWSTTPSGPGGLATISGFFQSRGLGTIPPGVMNTDIIPVTSDGSHNPFNFSAPFLGAQVLADSCGEGAGGAVDCPSTVPTPGTIALFGLGLAGLGFARRKKA